MVFTSLNMSMIRSVALYLGVVMLAGCASSINLNDVPVEDRQGTVVPAGSGGAGEGVPSGDVAARGGVEGVALDPTKAAAGQRVAGYSPLVYFDYDSYVVKGEFQEAIKAYAGQLKGDVRRKVQVEGHTDESGGREYNVGLGQKRADAVRAALVAAGALQSQVETVSYGKEKPAVSGSDEVSRSKNRRAVINY